jgi:hypothetical protein
MTSLAETVYARGKVPLDDFRRQLPSPVTGSANNQAFETGQQTERAPGQQDSASAQSRRKQANALAASDQRRADREPSAPEPAPPGRRIDLSITVLAAARPIAAPNVTSLK